uniref:Uncharacterized protein n=1 Tax=Magallana gigas TaxID=29159 RepID=K1QEV5_MAGGI
MKGNETGRFVYEGKNGAHRYCTTCETGQNDAINRRTQQSECIEKNFQVRMPDGSKEPICKEGISDSIIPGCGPLPASDGLSWRTQSGRPIQVKSTVYEVYYPICNQNGILNRDLHSARCGEDLRWNASIQGLRCLYGCGPFPIGSKWRMQNGSEAGNESLVGETYFSECSPGHKWSVVMYCGPDSKWNTNYSTPCESDQCGETVFIATKEKLNDSDCLQIWRQDPKSYRGVEMHPFLHCISCVEIGDSGVYYWRTASSSKERYCTFDLKVVDEPVCGLQIDTIYRDPIWDTFLKRLCYCLNSSASGRECACWREIAKMYLKRTDAYLSSIEWYKEDDPVNGPAYLILDDVRTAYRAISIGQLAANLQPPNLDLMNCINSFHYNCTFCTRLYYRMHQTRPKDVYG